MPGADETRILVADSPTGAGRPYSENAAIQLSSRSAPWDNSIVVELARLFPVGETPRCYTKQHTVVIYLGRRECTIERLIKKRFQKLTVSHGDIHVDPIGVSTGFRWKPAHQALMLAPSEPLIRNAMAESINPDRIEFIQKNGVADPQIFHIGLALLAELKSECPSGRLYGESLAAALAIRLLQGYAAVPPRISEYSRGLPTRQLRNLLAYIEDHLDADVGLSELATMCRMSQYYFCRMFRRSTGLSPHQYVMARRINRAKQLLIEKRLSLVEMAFALGFADQAHFCAAFHRAVGLSPGKYQKHLAS